VVQPFPNLGPIAAITTATTTSLIDTTSGFTSGHNVNLRGAELYNAHASTSTTVQVEHNDGTNTAIVAKVTLLAGEKLTYDGSRWLHYDSNGALYPSVGNAAVQSDMEAASALDKFVPPGMVKYHPGVCKAWGNFTVAGATTAGYNVDSPTDNGTGDITCNYTTDFSASNAYEVQVTVEMTATTYAVANARTAHIRNGGLAAGSTRFDCIDGTATTQLVKDPSSWHVSAMGDQA
jgi:hypothetical protein